MRGTLLGLGFAFCCAAFGAAPASAGPWTTTPAEALGLRHQATPVAMCGYSCRGGGRYIPGPPEVCADEGLRYCGSSRDSGGGYGPPRFFSDRDRYRSDGCRTVTIEREDGSVRRIRRCD